MHIYTHSIILLIVFGFYFESITGAEFSCFRRYRNKKRVCSSLMTRKTVNTPQKCCSSDNGGRGFTTKTLDAVGRNRYTCTSCKQWKKQIGPKIEDTFVCFRKWKKKYGVCGGPSRDPYLISPATCCASGQAGFSWSRNDVGRNKYTCTPCHVSTTLVPTTTTPTTLPVIVHGFVCFRKFRNKNGLCGGPMTEWEMSETNMTSPDTCCGANGRGFSMSREKVGQNKYTCTSCQSLTTTAAVVTAVTTTETIAPTTTPIIVTTTEEVWSEWGPWTGCSTTCGPGWNNRYRHCETCRNKHLNQQTQNCIVNYYCPVAGNWSDWSSWASCSQSCEGGVRSRQRECDNPSPLHGGQDCDGNRSQQGTCNEQACPTEVTVNGNWGAWGRFGRCSSTCGRGSMTRTRRCDSPAPSGQGKPCRGPGESSRRCERRKCPIHGGWSSWQEWSACPVTCGLGMRARSRTCDRPRAAFDGRPCAGSEIGSEECDTPSCPVDGGWSEWTGYGKCNGPPCQQGTRLQSRACNNPRPQHRGRMCRGRTVMRATCFNNEGCPVDGGWCEFSEWSKCSATCTTSSSTQSRDRICHCPSRQHGGKQCQGEKIEVRNCQGEEVCDGPEVDVNGG